MATTTFIDIYTHDYYCPHRYTYLWRALMATTTSINIYTHDYYCPYRYIYS